MGQKSGAYIFRPNGTLPTGASDPTHRALTVVSGPVYQEAVYHVAAESNNGGVAQNKWLNLRTRVVSDNPTPTNPHKPPQTSANPRPHLLCAPSPFPCEIFPSFPFPTHAAYPGEASCGRALILTSHGIIET